VVIVGGVVRCIKCGDAVPTSGSQEDALRSAGMVLTRISGSKAGMLIAEALRKSKELSP